MGDWSLSGDWASNGDWEGVLAGTPVGAGAETESAQAVTPILGTEFVVVGAAIETESSTTVSVVVSQSGMVESAIEAEQASPVAVLSSLSTVGAGWGVPIGIS